MSEPVTFESVAAKAESLGYQLTENVDADPADPAAPGNYTVVNTETGEGSTDHVTLEAIDRFLDDLASM